MSELSEEDIIKETNEWLKYDTNFINLPEYDAKNLYKVVQGLLDLYQKEKEKNDKLTEYIKENEIYKKNLFKNYEEMEKLYDKEKEKNKELENADLTTVYMNGFYDGEKKWKDKIKSQAIEYENNNEGYDCTTADYKQSQNIGKYLAYIELLEERN